MNMDMDTWTTIDLKDNVVVHVDYVKYSVWSRMTLESTSWSTWTTKKIVWSR